MPLPARVAALFFYKVRKNSGDYLDYFSMSTTA